MLKRIFDDAELSRAVDDPVALDRLIQDSYGFALEAMLRRGMMPSKKALMDSASALSVGFILDHIELERMDKRRLAQFFSHAMGSAKLSGELDEAGVELALREREQLPEKARLSAGMLRTMPEEILDQFDMSEHNISTILLESGKELSAQALLSAHPAILARFPRLLAIHPEVFKDLKAKALYKALVLAKAVKDERPVPWKAFLSWPFEKEDEAFFWSLFPRGKYTNNPSWNEVEKMTGFRVFSSKLEYFKRAAPNDLTCFSPEEIIEHKQAIQDAWIAELQGERYSSMSKMLWWKADLPGFKEVVDEAYVERVLEGGMQMRFDSIDRDRQDAREKANHVRRVILRLAIKNPEKLLGHKLYDADDLGAIAKELIGSGELADDRELARECAWAVMPIGLDSKNGYFGGMIRNGSNWLVDELFEDVSLWAATHHSPNMAVLALEAWSAAAKRDDWQTQVRREALADLIVSMKPSLGAFAGDLYKAYGFKAPKRKPGSRWIKPDNAIDSAVAGIDGEAFEHQAANRARYAWHRAQTEEPSFSDCNVFDSGYGRWLELSWQERRLLAERDRLFAAKFLSSGAAPDESLLCWLLDSDAPHARTALRAICKKFGKEARGMEKFSSALRRRPEGAAAAGLKFPPAEPALDIYGKAVEAWREAARLDLKARRGAPRDGHDGADASLSALRLAVSKAVEGLTFHERVGEIAKSLRNDDFAGASACMERAPVELGADAAFAQKCKSMTVDVFTKTLSDDVFFEALAAKAVSMDSKCVLGLDFGSVENNLSAARALANSLGDSADKALHAFESTARWAFANRFAIERHGAQVVYTYALFPSRGETCFSSVSKGSQWVDAPYANDDIVKLWDKAGGAAGFFVSNSRDDKASEFFSRQYTGRPEAYFEMLDLAKSRPGLYALLVEATISNSLAIPGEFGDGDVDKGFKRATRDYIHASFVAKHFDQKLLRRGVEDVLEAWSAQARNPRWNTGSARMAILNVMWATSYDEYDGAMNSTHASVLSESDTEAWLRLFIDKAPFLIHDINTVGSAKPVEARIERDAESLLGRKALDILLPPADMRPSYFTLEGQSGEMAALAAKGALRAMISLGLDEDLAYLDFLVKQRAFIDEEIDYDHAPDPVDPIKGAIAMELVDFMAKRPELMELLSVGAERSGLRASVGDAAARRKKARSL